MKRFISLFVGVMALLVLTQGVYAQSVEMNSAKLYFKQDQYDTAMVWFERAINKKPDNAEAHYRLGELYGMKGRIAEMLREFDASVKYDQKKKYAQDIAKLRLKYLNEYFKIGVDTANARDYAKALEYFNKTKLFQPEDSAKSYKNLVYVYSHMDSVDVEAMLKVCQESLAINPNDYEMYLTLARIYDQRKEYEKTVEFLQKAMAVAPDHARVTIISQLGVTYDTMGKRDEAMRIYQDALKMNPGNKDILFNLGRLYLMREDYPSAIKQLDEVLKNDPEDFNVNYQVGVSYLMIGEQLNKKARVLEDEASASKSKKKPDIARIDSLRQAASESFKAATPYLKKAVELKPDDGNAWHNLGVSYLQTGKTAEGTKAISKADSLRGEK